MEGRVRSRAARLGGLKNWLATVVLGLVLGMSASVIPAPASAQNFDWLGKLFGGGQPRPAPQVDAPGSDRHGVRGRPRRHVAESPRVRRDTDRPLPKHASLFVYVIGDAFGQNLASGLDEALADRQEVAIIHKAQGSTGLATPEVFDWPKAVDAMLAAAATAPRRAAGAVAGKDDLRKDDAGESVVDKAKPAAIDPATKVNPADANPIGVAVMMIGSNDRQAIRLDGETLRRGTPEWTTEYRKRVMAIDEAFRRKGIPLIWVGVPIARDDGFADDMAAFNDIYREAAAKTGTVYVDTWEAFSDDNGEFRAVGPDINGQTTRLRMADGINFTKAGSRKLAHFVEVHVRRALDGKMVPPPPETPTPNTPTPDVALAHKPDVGPISNLLDVPLSRGGHLAVAYGVDAQTGISIARGNPPPTPAGRADDLKWPDSGMPNP